MKKRTTVPILVADDDIEDCEMIREAFVASRLLNEIQFVHDGEQLIHSLHNRLENSNLDQNHLPGVILLDLNMPKMDGREVLKALKGHPTLMQIPIIVLTTSKAEEDVIRSYNLGASSFISKPVEFESLVQIMRDLGRYWFEIVELPNCEKLGHEHS